MTNKEKARMILEALEDAPIDFHWINADKIIKVIARVLDETEGAE